MSRSFSPHRPPEEPDDPNTPSSTAALWARFRFSVVGSLLSSPPPRGALKTAIRSLAAKTWTHPTTGRDVQLLGRHHRAVVLHGTARHDDPVAVLRRAVRKDCGKVSLATALAERLSSPVPRAPALELPTPLRQPRRAGRRPSPRWGRSTRMPRCGATCRRTAGCPGPGSHPKQRPGEARAETRRQTREVRSYEAAYVGALWHLDFHHGSLKVLTPGGQWLRPIALGILDDHSRLCCHVQWYLSETAEDLVHGLSQAIQKRGLPRALLTDNGSAMVAEEVTEGLLRLGIVHERTLPYSPYQNGKQEAFWGTLEGRLMKMLDGVAELTLDVAQRSDPGVDGDRVQPRRAPRDRLLAGRALRPGAGRAPRQPFERVAAGRVSPGNQADVSGRAMARSRWRACGSRSRHGIVTSAKWPCATPAGTSAGSIWSTARSGTILAPIYPLDKTANADGRRAVRRARRPRRAAGEPARATTAQLPPLLEDDPRRSIPPRACRRRTCPRHHRPQTGERLMNSKKLLALWGLKWNPFSPELPSEALLVTARDRALRLARRTAGPGGGLRADHGRVGDRQVGGAADRRRAAFGAAGRHGRCDRAAPVEEPPTSIASWATSSR